MKTMLVILAIALAATIPASATETEAVKSNCPKTYFPPTGEHSSGKRDRNLAIAAVAVVAIGVTVSIKLGWGHRYDSAKSSRVKVSAFAKSN